MNRVFQDEPSHDNIFDINILMVILELWYVVKLVFIIKLYLTIEEYKYKTDKIHEYFSLLLPGSFTGIMD
ncbi:MAG: hypothetical protein ACOCUL_03035 [Bacteroidota bacterium]